MHATVCSYIKKETEENLFLIQIVKRFVGFETIRKRLSPYYVGVKVFFIGHYNLVINIKYF